MAGKSADLTHQKFRVGRTIGPAAFFLEDLQNIRVGRCLDSKIFLIALVPGKGLVDFPCRFADTFFIIDVKWRWISLCNFLDLCFRNNGTFFMEVMSPLVQLLIPDQPRIIRSLSSSSPEAFSKRFRRSGMVSRFFLRRPHRQRCGRHSS